MDYEGSTRLIDALIDLGVTAGAFEVIGSVLGFLAGVVARGLGMRRARYVEDGYGRRWIIEPINLLLWFGWGAAVGAVFGHRRLGDLPPRELGFDSHASEADPARSRRRSGLGVGAVAEASTWSFEALLLVGGIAVGIIVVVSAPFALGPLVPRHVHPKDMAAHQEGRRLTPAGRDIPF